MYVELLKERATLPGSPCKCHFFSSFFFSRLTKDDPINGYCFAGVNRWTRKIDLFSFDKVILPVHLSSHWTCAVINLRDRRFEFYDSMGGEGKVYLEILRR